MPTPRLSAATRVVLVGIAAGLAGLLGLAGWLTPDPRGHGTHTQLGLPPCPSFAARGIRCPACGVTTAMALAVRGRVGAGFGANPAGVLLAGAAAGLVPWLLLSAASGRPRAGARSADGPLLVAAVVVATVGVLSWFARILLGRA
jgi:hypothetical protein